MKSKIKDVVLQEHAFQPVGKDWSESPIEEFTNEGATVFCPYIDNKKLAKLICSKKGEGIIHRDVYTKVPGPVGPVDFDTKFMEDLNPKNKKYHWVQVGFQSFQCCKYQKDLVSTEKDLCQYHFISCQIYKENSKKSKV